VTCYYLIVLCDMDYVQCRHDMAVCTSKHISVNNND
jgi:hypothetical protein